MRKYISVIVYIVILLAGCSGEKFVPLTGQIVGFLKLFDERGFELSAHSDVVVSLDNGLTTTTDASGRFEFNGLGTGNYRFTFEKEGFGKAEKFNVQFVPGNVPAVVTANLIALPVVVISNVRSGALTEQAVTVSGTISKTDSYYFGFYFSSRPDVSNFDFDTSANYSYCCLDATSFEVKVAITSAESPLYMVGYFSSAGAAQNAFNYLHAPTNKSVNPSMRKFLEPVKIR